MNRFYIDTLFFTIYVAISAFGLYKLKQSPDVLSKGFAIGFACYASGFLLWILILRRLPLSVAFPVAAGSLVLATQMLGWWFLGESFDARQLTGVVLVVLGVSLIYLRTAA